MRSLPVTLDEITLSHLFNAITPGLVCKLTFATMSKHVISLLTSKTLVISSTIFSNLSHLTSISTLKGNHNGFHCNASILPWLRFDLGYIWQAYPSHTLHAMQRVYDLHRASLALPWPYFPILWLIRVYYIGLRFNFHLLFSERTYYLIVSRSSFLNGLSSTNRQSNWANQLNAQVVPMSILLMLAGQLG